MTENYNRSRDLTDKARNPRRNAAGAKTARRPVVHTNIVAKSPKSDNTAAHRGRETDAQTSWIVKKELSPGSTYFPLSHFSSVMRGAREEDYLFTIRLAFDQAVTSDGSGTIATVLSDSPVQAQNWTNYAAVFDEYRILAYKVTFEPFWTVNCTFAPVASVVDRSDATALTGYGLAERYASHKKAMGKQKWFQVVNMSDGDDSTFVSTASTSAKHWIKAYSAGNTASFTFGRYNAEMIVQFRGVGIN